MQTFTEHLKVLSARCWDGKKMVLFCLYVLLVCSALDYGSFVYGRATNFKLSTLFTIWEYVPLLVSSTSAILRVCTSFSLMSKDNVMLTYPQIDHMCLIYAYLLCSEQASY